VLCPLPKERFFAALDISITTVFGGGADVWNVSTQWAYDGQKQRQRTDTQALVRELSSGSSYQRFVYESVTTNGSVYAVGAKGGCTVSPALEGTFPAEACVGSVSRWMPSNEMRNWKGQGFQADTFIGYQVVNGMNASTWGWTYHAGGNPHAPVYSRHRMYLAATGGRLPAGTPLMEEQTIDELSGYLTKATIVYRTFEDVYGGASAIFDQPWAGAFTPCSPVHQMTAAQPKAKQSTTCACHGPTWIEIDDGASGVGGHCYDTLCIENKEAHWQHPLSDCARIGGQKPFCPTVEPTAGGSSEAFCCTSCSAGGCSAFYSPKDAGYPYACSKGEIIVPIPGHGQTCRASSTA